MALIEQGLFDSMSHLKDEMLTREGGLSLAMLDALLIIPLGMAAFFYPVPALAVVVGILAVTGGWLWVARHHTRPH